MDGDISDINIINNIKESASKTSNIKRRLLLCIITRKNMF